MGEVIYLVTVRTDYDTDDIRAFVNRSDAIATFDEYVNEFYNDNFMDEEFDEFWDDFEAGVYAVYNNTYFEIIEVGVECGRGSWPRRGPGQRVLL
jgi:hypothetical protein